MHSRQEILSGKMESAAPYDTSFTPEYRLKIIGGKQTYVPDYSQRPIDRRPEAPGPPSLPSSGGSNRSSSEKRNTWTSHSVLPPILSPRNSDLSQRTDLPVSTPLPTQPLVLSKVDEIELMRSVGSVLNSSHSMDILKQIYNDLSSAHDPELTGWAKYSDIASVLQTHQVNLSKDDLRTASCMFVTVERPGYVNYERLLSLLASAIKLNNSRKDPQYFAQTSEKQNSNLDFLSINTRAPRPSDEVAGAQGKLIRLVTDQLSLGEFPLDIEKLRNQFSMADRLHRDSLSHGEIKEICYRNRVPLQESVINHVLDRCRTTGDGQYRWSDFIDFLEKIQPTGTGLAITSKQPHEYVKKLPEPKDSWPRPDFGQSEPPSTYKHNPRVPYSEPGAPVTAGQHNSGDANPVHSSKSVRDSRENPITPKAQSAQSYMSISQQAYGSKVASASNQPRSEGKQMHSDAVQTENLVSPDVLLPKRLQDDENDVSWLDRFGKLAQALYRSDLDKNGMLKPDECRWLLTEYNDIYGLSIPKDVLEDSLKSSSTAQGTSIDSILKEILQTVQ
ncbi:uncharacterized protein C1orf87-like isoform X1 [Watersipora subatra]|uniref:uncharacterized protein C1orf87-like isoform X1 n=1 Tax=Watersipora subatra TaxID=2589382 RepID=UPI00355BC3C0